MDKLFLQIVNMSITSSYVILFVILIRLLLKKAPKIYSYILWAVVFLRLIIPISFENIFSFIPINTNTIPQDVLYTKTPEINSGIRAIDGIVNNSLAKPVVGRGVNLMEILIDLGQVIWIIGIFGLIIYSIVSTIKLYKTLKSSRILSDGIYETNIIEIPFVLGTIKPKIYIPSGLSEREKDYIIRHEKTHIRRYDHIIKFVAFIITSIHWFNPLVWMAYLLMSKDMELSCDEAVIKEMGNSIKKDYSTSLLKLSTSKRMVVGSTLAFGGKATKNRIKNILNYKKPKFWVSIIAIITIVVVAIGLLSNPSFDKGEINLEDRDLIEPEITYDISQAWEVEDKWKLTIDKIYITEERNHKSDRKEGQTQYTDQRPEKVFKLQYTYENFDDSLKLLLIPEKIVLDTGERSYEYPLYEIDHPFPLEGKGICEKGEFTFAFDNMDSTHVKIYFNAMDNNLIWQKFIYEYDLNNVL